MDRRFKIFKRTARFVHKTNNSRGSCQVGMNLFADQTLEEITGPRCCSFEDPPASSCLDLDAGKGYQIEIGGPIPEEAERALTVTEETLKSDEALRAMYEYWCRYHGVSRDRAEMDRRFKIFKRTARFVHKTNNSGVSYKVGLNQCADLTAEEIARTRG